MATIAVWDCWSLFKQESPRTPILNTLVPGLGSLPSWIHYPDVWSASHVLSNLPGRWRLLLPSSMSILLLLLYPLSFLLPLPTHSCPAHSWWPSVNLSVPTPPGRTKRGTWYADMPAQHVWIYLFWSVTSKLPLAAENLEIKEGTLGREGLIQSLKLARTNGITLELHKGPYVSYL